MNWLQKWRWFSSQKNSKTFYERIFQIGRDGEAYIRFYADKDTYVGTLPTLVRFNWIQRL